MAFATIATHKCLGRVLITDECYNLQDNNPDPSSFFILHDGVIKEVTKTLVTPIELTWID